MICLSLWYHALVAKNRRGRSSELLPCRRTVGLGRSDGDRINRIATTRLGAAHRRVGVVDQNVRSKRRGGETHDADADSESRKAVLFQYSGETVV